MLVFRIVADPRQLEYERRQTEALESIAKTLAEIEAALRPTRVPSSIQWTLSTPTNEE